MSILLAPPVRGYRARGVPGLAVAAVVATGWACHATALSRRLSAARTDPVTGLITRAVFEDRVPRVLARRSCLVALVDQDEFKTVNDTHGHAVGDNVLRRTAGHLTGWAGPRGPVARIGGDEFVAVRPDRAGAAQSSLSRLHRALTGTVPGTGDPTGASVGGVLVPAGTALSDALSWADRAMYEAKATRSGWVLADAQDAETPGGLRRHKRTGIPGIGVR